MPLKLYAPEPSTLSTFTFQDSRSSLPDPQTHHIQLALLQPLAGADMLAASRDPDSRYMQDGNGNRLSSRTNNEYLDLTTLGKAWRQAWAQLPIASITQVTFDGSLPEYQDDTGARQKVYWDASLPSRGGLAVRGQDFTNLVILLATVLRMRASSGVEFRAVFNASDNPYDRDEVRLHQQLRNLSTSTDVSA